MSQWWCCIALDQWKLLIDDVIWYTVLIQESLIRHKQLNMYEALNGGSAVYGVNVFSDLTQEEFKSTFVCQSTYIEVT